MTSLCLVPGSVKDKKTTTTKKKNPYTVLNYNIPANPSTTWQQFIILTYTINAPLPQPYTINCPTQKPQKPRTTLVHVEPHYGNENLNLEVLTILTVISINLTRGTNMCIYKFDSLYGPFSGVLSFSFEFTDHIISYHIISYLDFHKTC